MPATAVIVSAVISAVFSVRYLIMIILGSLCIQGMEYLCGPGSYGGGIAMIVIGAVFLPGQVLYTILYACKSRR